MVRSRTEQFKNNLVAYDFLTQYTSIKYDNLPILISLDIKIKNKPTGDTKQICLNLISLQLVGNHFVVCKSHKNVYNFTSRSTGMNAYLALENLALLAYKKNIMSPFSSKNSSRKSQSIVYSKNFLNIIEYFSLDSIILKLLEKTSTEHFKITFSYQVSSNADSDMVEYFLKSLGFPY
uniref:Uncharacterized protein n=1 Tax=Pyropia perforata TaxID=182771 RepID=A0A059SV15_PYRPE|nr:hypothetical protein [Neoporphyra perforata]